MVWIEENMREQTNSVKAVKVILEGVASPMIICGSEAPRLNVSERRRSEVFEV